MSGGTGWSRTEAADLQGSGDDIAAERGCKRPGLCGQYVASTRSSLDKADCVHTC